MKIVNSFEDIRGSINRVRSLRKGFITNYFPEQRKVEIWCSHRMLWEIETEEAVIFLKKDDGFTSVMYCATSTEKLFSALTLLDQREVYIIDQIVDARTDRSILDTLTNAGFKIRSSLVRMSKINIESSTVDVQDYLVAEEDIPAILALLHANFDKYSEQLPTIEELKDFVDAKHVIAQRINNQIAGFIIYDQTPSTLYLRYWLVNNEFRNKGVGSSLFREFSRRGNKCKRHILWVMEDNYNAIEKYKHYGYSGENMRNYVLALNLN